MVKNESIYIRRKFLVKSDIQNVFKKGEIILLKALCDDGIHLFECDNREVYMHPNEIEEILS